MCPPEPPFVDGVVGLWDEGGELLERFPVGTDTYVYVGQVVGGELRMLAKSLAVRGSSAGSFEDPEPSALEVSAYDAPLVGETREIR